MSQLINAACVSAPVKNGRNGPVQRVTLSSLSAGLNTGINQWSRGTTTVNGQTLSGDNNDDVQGLPVDIRNATGGIWVQRNGAIQGAATNYGVHPTFTVIGKGECYWNGPGARNVLGSCNPCNPYIAPLHGWFGSCYVLVSGTWMKDVYFTGGNAGLFTDPPPRRGNSNTGIKECYGVPAAGNYLLSAPNCHRVSTPTPSGGGASDVPLTRHIVYAGSVGVIAEHTRVAAS